MVLIILFFHFNPLSPCGERQDKSSLSCDKLVISIHSPRVGRDVSIISQAKLKRISIHSPRVGRDKKNVGYCKDILLFQSTLPVWGETNFLKLLKLSDIISIHSPRVGRDSNNITYKTQCIVFQSTLPVWGETVTAHHTRRRDLISIHSPRVGRDSVYMQMLQHKKISIHSPRVGRDLLLRALALLLLYFNPLSPCGERPCKSLADIPHCYFNPLSPCGERLIISFQIVFILLFQSTLPVWGETMQCQEQ